VLLAGTAARFALAFPQVKLEIVADDRFIDPVEDGFDVVLRMNPATDDALVGRCVLKDERWLVASPSIASPLAEASASTSIGVPAVMASAAKSNLKWQIRTRENQVVSVQPEPLLRLSSLLMVKQAVLSGVGAALLPRLLVEADVQSEHLSRWGVEQGAPVEIWALYNSRRLLSAKVRAFMNWLVAELAPNTDHGVSGGDG
jgi:DNA-binding transcriptional LysR family regulator